jgi:hypothetical protein
VLAMRRENQGVMYAHGTAPGFALLIGQYPKSHVVESLVTLPGRYLMHPVCRKSMLPKSFLDSLERHSH